MILNSLSTWSRTSTAVFLWNGYNFFPLGWLHWFFLLLLLFSVSSQRICEGRSLQADIAWGRMNDQSLMFLGRITLHLFKYLCPCGSWWAVPDCCSALQLLNNLHLNCPSFFIDACKALRSKKFNEKKTAWIIQGFRVALLIWLQVWALRRQKPRGFLRRAACTGLSWKAKPWPEGRRSVSVPICHCFWWCWQGRGPAGSWVLPLCHCC